MSVITAAEPQTVRTTVAATGLVGALASAAYIASFLLPELTMRDAARHPLVLTANAVAALAFVGLAVSVPRLTRSTRFPAWALQLTAAGCAFVAAVAWAQATTLPHMASLLSDAQMEAGTGFLDLLWYPKMLLCSAGLAALAVVGWRRAAAPKAVLVLLGVAAVASLLPPYPPGALLAGLALTWLARTAKP